MPPKEIEFKHDERHLARRPDPHARLAELLGIAHRIHAQQRHDKHKRYEFGVKVSIATTNRDNFVVGMQAVPGNLYDGHTLERTIEQVTALTGKTPRQAYVDRGYRAHGVRTLSVWIAGAKRAVTAWIRKRRKRRNAIEPVIGHMKGDGHLDRNFLKGEVGDALNALLCGCGHNLRKILNHLHFFPSQKHAAAQ